MKGRIEITNEVERPGPVLNFLFHNRIVAIPVLTENTLKYLGMRDMMFKTLYSLVTLWCDLCAQMCHACMWRSEDKWWSEFPPSTAWVPGIERGSSCLVASTFTCRVVSLAPPRHPFDHMHTHTWVCLWALPYRQTGKQIQDYGSHKQEAPANSFPIHAVPRSPECEKPWHSAVTFVWDSLSWFILLDMCISVSQWWLQCLIDY